MQIGGTFLGVSEGLPDDFPRPTVPPQPTGGLSGGEIAAIVILLTLAAIAAVVVGVIAVLYYVQRRRKYRIGTAEVTNIYLSDADTFDRATLTSDQQKLVESQVMVMMTKEDTLPKESLVIAINEAAIGREAEETDLEDIDKKSDILKSDEDTHL